MARVVGRQDAILVPAFAYVLRNLRRLNGYERFLAGWGVSSLLMYAYLGEKTPRIDHPQAVMYEPDAQGRMNLIGVEYISLKGPAVALEGQLFAFQGSPNRYGLPAFYELHVWAFRNNTKGTYVDFNPAVSCAGFEDQPAHTHGQP